MTIQQQIFALQDKPYGEFQSRLLPTIAKERIIGVRIPVMRKLAKQLTKEEPEAVQAFLEELPHTYYDGDILHANLGDQGLRSMYQRDGAVPSIYRQLGSVRYHVTESVQAA